MICHTTHRIYYDDYAALYVIPVLGVSVGDTVGEWAR